MYVSMCVCMQLSAYDWHLVPEVALGPLGRLARFLGEHYSRQMYAL